MNNLVAIVGRPNVGKSTLFNRLTKTRQAIVNEEAGTTRDRQYGKSEWLGREFSVVDTGGWVVNSDDIFEEEIRKQVLLAVEEADVILFVVDVMNGVTDLDMQVATILRRANSPVIMVANKTDNNELQYNAPEFYKLGLGDPYCISAITGSGTGDLMDLIVSKFNKETSEILDDDIPRFAVVGRPNAGKSSIVNAFIGEDRNIVTEIAGTTRDSIYTRYNKFGFDFYLVDTAGIRKKNKVNEDLEYYSVVRSIRSIENADVCILMLDATRGVESQDLNILSLIQKNQKGLVVVINKWDLIEDKTAKMMKEFEATIRSRFAPFVDFPIIFASALTKQRILKVSITPAAGVALGDIAQASQQIIDNLEDVPQDVSLYIGGNYEDQQESFSSLIWLLLLSLMLVYIVMAAQFESFKMPFIIMLAIPFAFTGVILALLLTNTTLSIVAALGAIMLVGIVTKNGIVLIDFINLMRERGIRLYDAIAQACRSRLRPVLMTSLTTILGMVPMAISAGEGSETWRPMGIAVIGGMVFSTIITMIIVPAVYAAMDKSGSRDKKKALAKEFKFMKDFDPEKDLPKK